MADGKIEFELQVTGAEASASAIDSVKRSQEQLAQSAQQVTQRTQQVTRAAAAQQLTVTQLGGKWGQLGGAMGNVGSVLGRLSPQMGAFGQVLGQVGSASTALTGALGPVGVAIAAVTTAVGLASAAMELMNDRTNEAATAARNAKRGYDDLTASMQRFQQRASGLQSREDINARQQGVEARYEALRASLAGEQQSLARRLRAGEGRATTEGGRRVARNLAANSPEARAARERIATLQAQLESTRGEFRGLQRDAESAAAREQLGTFESLDRAMGSQGGRRGGRRRAPTEQRDFFDEAETENELEAIERADALREQMHQLHMERMEAEKEKQREVAEEAVALAEAQKAKAEELREAEIAQLEKVMSEARAANEELRDEALSVLQPAVQGLTKAMSEVIAGSKSADEAFQGLLSSFLEMIAQQTALQAAKEFAEAIAAFARYDYAGGAQHIGAGVAFTAVAVAAGAASIAVAPPAEAVPAAPQGGMANAGGGITNVINWNSPVITAGTRADLGRELDGMIGEGRRRFGG